MNLELQSKNVGKHFAISKTISNMDYKIKVKFKHEYPFKSRLQTATD